MSYFYELSHKNAGYSRIGRIIISKKGKKYIPTPEILIPMKRTLMNSLGFLEQFQDHKLFIVSKEVYLKIGFLQEKFKDTGFIFTHYGTLTRFNEILNRNFDKISQNNVICIIPFNVPTTSISKEFAINEITNYLHQSKKILSKHSNIIFGLSIRVFDYPELIELYFSLIKENSNVKIINLIDLFDNFIKFRKIMDAVIQLKSNLDNNLVLMASGKIIPNQYPFLIYMGIDLINPLYMLYLSSENFYNSFETLLPIYKVHNFACSCFACSGELKKIKEKKYSAEKIELLSHHNIISASNEVNKIKQYLKTEDFRNYVEKSVMNNLNLISSLKILDKKYYDVLKFDTPIIQQEKTINCIGEISYNRPDFHQFRDRVLNTFIPEPWTTLFIIYPCSSKKPYSESKSHKAFQKTMRKFPEFPCFQELILTSPLGAIPRQYENVYPVCSYDISVTGFWDKEEVIITANMLKGILEKYDKKIPILCHLKGKGYRNVIIQVRKEIKNPFYFTEVSKSLASKESLDSLFEKINSLKDVYQPQEQFSIINHVQKSWNRKIIRIFDYQFGKGLAEKILQNRFFINKDKRFNKIRILERQYNELLGTFSFESGQVTPTLKCFDKIDDFSLLENYIIFDGDKITGTTLFRPGILEYSSDLKPGQIIIILNKNKDKIIALGRLIIGKNNIDNTKSGKVVEIYEKL